MSTAETAPSFVQDLPSQLTGTQKAFTMLGALLGLLLAALDQTIVATAGPIIQRDLAIEASLYTWITTAYLVSSTVLVPVYGKLSDLWGRRTILVIGIAIFLTGSLLCGLSQSSMQLIFSRAVQGMGSAALFTTAFAVVADIFPPAERGKWQGLFGSVFGLSSVVGPLAGGFITDHFGWHWVFFVNLPLGAMALVLIFARMPALRRSLTHKPKVDVVGAGALAVGVVPLLVALSLGRVKVMPGETGFVWGSPQVVGMLAVAAVGLVAFVLWEMRAAEPILDMRLFGNRAFALGNMTAFVSGAGFLAAIVFLPLFMVNVVGLSATSSGLTTTPLTFGIVFGNIFAGRLVSRLERYKVIILASLVILAVAYAVMGFTLTPQSTQAEVSLKMVLMGVGLGPSIPLLTLAVQSSVPPQQIGVATSTATFFRQMGATVGLALLGTAFATTLTGRMEATMATARQDMPAAMGTAMGTGEDGAPRAGMGNLNGAVFKQRIHSGFALKRTRLQEALARPEARAELLADPTTAPALRTALTSLGTHPAPPEVTGQVLAGLDDAETQALAQVDRISAALKMDFTQAISVIYRWAILIALLALFLTLRMPEQPLVARPAPRPSPPPPAD